MVVTVLSVLSNTIARTAAGGASNVCVYAPPATSIASCCSGSFTDPERQMRGFLVEPLALTAYCDHACQTQHWVSHRYFCFGPNRGLGAGFGAASTAAPQSDVTSLRALDEIEQDLVDDVDLDNVPEPETAPEWSGDSDGSQDGEGFHGDAAEVEQVAACTVSVSVDPVESVDATDSVELPPAARGWQGDD